MKALASLKANDMVEVRAAGNPPKLQSIRVYELPKVGEFVKVGKEKVEEEELTSVEIKGDGDSQTLMIPTKDTALTSRVRSLKAGNMVLYRGSTDDKGTVWLVEIKAAPKEAKAPEKKPTKTPPVKPAPNDDSGE